MMVDMRGCRAAAVSALAKAIRAAGWARAMLAAAAWGLAPRLAMAVDATDDDYYQQWAQNDDAASDLIGDTFGFSGSKDQNPLPNFTRAVAQVSGIVVMLVPAIFVVKFAGRAMLSLVYADTDSTRSQGISGIPEFFRSSKERGKQANIQPGAAWYVDMAKDFLLWFGVAVGVWTIFEIISGVVYLLFSKAPSDGTNYMGYFEQG